jgi:hypothetical protein
MPFRYTEFGLAITLCAAIVFATGARADDRAAATDPKTVREVTRLLAQLDADTRGDRTKARDGLLALGPAILPLLPEDQKISSAQVRQALHEIRLRLEHESAQASLRPLRVTLKGTFSLRDLVTRIAAQTGNEFDTGALDEALLARGITVDFESRTFWSACDKVIRSAGLEYGGVSKGRLQLVRANANSEERCVAVADDGAFRVAIASASIRQSVGSRTSYALRIGWSLRAEPRLRPLFASIAGSSIRAQTAAQAPATQAPATQAPATQAAITVFRPISPAAKLELSMDEGQEALRLTSDFECPAGIASPKIDLSGSFAVEMAAGPTRFIFDDLVTADQPAKRVGNVAVRLRHVEFPANGQAGEARVDISAVYDEHGPAFESFRTWMYRNEMWLETKEGHRIRPEPLVAPQRQDDGGIVVEYNFAGVTGTPAGYRVVYVAPTLITESPVQFQLRNIPTTRAGQQGAQP